MSTKPNTRKEYRKKTQQRQTLVFGTVGGLMTLLFAFVLLVWSGVFSLPFEPKFSSSDEEENLVTPCIEENTQAVKLTDITVRIYNSTKKSGLANQAGEKLAGMGVIVPSTDNWNGKQISESARIIVGKDAIDAAYTLAQYIPDSLVQYDPDTADEVVTLVLGTKYDGVKTTDDVNASNPGGILNSPSQCTTISKGSAK
ncbi:MAG: LytR C-terminal domain-containing protein [Actinomycetaceae bacterium]|nr:LytR C-terminal domain-containing protein [Actinomycetaceae bacterium]